MRIAKIVSGGQTGADRGGLDAALHCELPIGGWLPRGQKSEDGRVPDKYVGMVESDSADYLVRTKANIVDSDATIVFCHGTPTGGSKKTVEFAKELGRPCQAFDLDRPRQTVTDQVIAFLEHDCPDGDVILNVAGSRESKSPCIAQEVMVRMVDVIARVNRVCFYPLAEEG